MDPKKFITVGENIHCTRVLKRGGPSSVIQPGGGEGVKFTFKGAERVLPIPADWGRFSPPYEDGKIKHVALAVFQARKGQTEKDRAAGEDYLRYLAERQIAKGATFLDVNCDEYCPDSAETVKIMAWLAGFLSANCACPLSIDSSKPETIEAGLNQCRRDIAPPMINSISLERPELIAVAKKYNADAIVNAAGRSGMPANADERMANFCELIPMLERAGIARGKMHLDPLVLPISTDAMNGNHFLTATALAAKEFKGVHLTGGLSNVSFGMPNRRLINLVFAWLGVQSGTDGGIIDPVTMPATAIAGLDPDSKPFQLARALLVGEDQFGVEYIAAHREGLLE